KQCVEPEPAVVFHADGLCAYPVFMSPHLCLQENVSLADILSLRDSCLSEEEVWAVCAECVVALQSIRPSHLFHTLCITPDTLAFNAHGNVCFMEQLSDDPEGSFVPPEFDSTGSTFEGHVYSLGSTLSAALNFVIEPELEAELGEEIQRLLEQMQEEKPEDRPLLQDILSLAEGRLSHTSSAAVCRKLSSIGRRVLSIESVSTFQGHVIICVSPFGISTDQGEGGPEPVLLRPGLQQPPLRFPRDPWRHQHTCIRPHRDWSRRTTEQYVCVEQQTSPTEPGRWISLTELLTRCGRRLTVNELWALCYTCLSSLQTYIDFPGEFTDSCFHCTSGFLYVRGVKLIYVPTDRPRPWDEPIKYWAK
uniref:KIND domain-containing protein n=1 Tax=Sphaeramia orbicularis TaxID=375764 RepID=A0A673CCR3_9TELE